MGISTQQFKQMQARLAGAPRKAQPGPGVPAGPLTEDTVILGLDPSLRGTGYGVIQTTRPSPRTLAHGTIRCPAS